MAQVIRTVLEADASRAVAGFGQAERAAGGYEKRLSGLSGSIRNNRAEWDQIGTTAMVAGGAMVAGLGLATKAAIDWESAWAGVQKTTDGTPEQMAALEGELRGLAKTLPATHEEIAGVAEAAGQLGIERENVTDFTKTMIDMGESTNMSAEEAATAIARFSNVMGTAQDEASNIGSSVVELGNNFATTEGEIMAMSTRLAGAGSQANMTEGDVLGIAAAMSSVGIEAEAGGTAMSRVIIEMGKSVDMGNEKLEVFARTAGMSTEAFSKLWSENSGEAMQRFIGGLGEMQARGESLEPTLAELGMTDIRVGDALRRSAGAADLFTEAMSTGNSAYEANAALAKEAQQRYETDAARIKIAGNQIKDAMIGFGADIAPVVATVVEGIADIVDWFGRLPGPVKTFISSLTGITGAALLLGGATIKAVGFAQDIAGAFETISARGPRAEAAIGGVGRSARIAAGAFAALAAARALADTIQDDDMAVGPKELAKASTEASDKVKSLNKALEENAVRNNEADSTVKTLDEALRVAFDPSMIEQFGETNANVWEKVTFGLADITSKAEEADEAFKLMDDTLADMFTRGDGDEAAAMLDQWIEAANDAGVSTKEFMKKLPQTREAMAATGTSADELGGDFSDMGGEAETAEDSISDLSDEITGLGDTMLNQRGSARDYQKSLRDIAEALKENGRTLDISTEAGAANEAALDDLANSTQEWASATLEATGDVDKAQGILDKGRQQWIDYATSMGMPKREARELADELFKIPEETKAEFKTEGAGKAKADADGFKQKLLDLDETNVAPGVQVKGAEKGKTDVSDLQGAIGALFGKDVTVKESGSAPSKDRVGGLQGTIEKLGGKSVIVTENGARVSRARVMDLDTEIELLDGKKVSVLEEGASPSRGRVKHLDGAIFGLDDKSVTVTEVGSTAAGGRVVSFKGKIYEIPPVRESEVRANVHGLWDVQAMIGAIAGVKPKTVTITTIGKKIGSWVNADGGMYSPSSMGMWPTFADGGTASFQGQPPQIRRAGGMGVTWAEEGAGPWEAFISGHPGKRARSEAIWRQTGARLGLLESATQKFASGGVYGDWQKWLRELKRMSSRSQYRFEDGSRKIRVFEDGTAQWRGYGAAPAGARRAIARLNASQDRYEDALNRKSARSSAPKYTGQHSDYYYRKQAEWAAIRARGSSAQSVRRGSAPRITPKPPRTGAFTRITPPAAKQHLVAPPRQQSFQRMPATSSMSQSMSPQQMESAIVSAFSRVRVTTNINGRDFQGVINRTNNDRKGR